MFFLEDHCCYNLKFCL
uniref:Uncharacterized protein n=1 Tax=Anguilla anguilla TaxID=7936 RepID=A0A0E9T6A0_ANGAN